MNAAQTKTRQMAVLMDEIEAHDEAEIAAAERGCALVNEIEVQVVE